jgi:hypothetical protein
MDAKDNSSNSLSAPQRKFKLLETLAALGLYTFLALIVTWPALFHLHDRVLGAYPGDNFQFLWALWYVAHATLDLHVSPFFDPNIYVPFGFSLFRNLGEVSPATILVSIPLTRLLGEVATYNLLIMSSFALTGLGTFLLARELRAGIAGSLVAGVGVGFCAYHFAHATGHLSLASTQWIPFFFLFLERTVRTCRIRDGILMGLFYSLSALVSWYYASLVPIAAVFYLGFRLKYRDGAKPLIRLIKPGLAGVACAVVLVLPFAVPYMRAMKQGTMATRSSEESQAFSASVADFFIPSVRHPLFGPAVIRSWRSGSNGLWLSEWDLYLGTLIMPLAVAGLLRPKDGRIKWGLIAMSAAAFVLALGPSLYFVHPPCVRGAENLAPLSQIPLPVSMLKDFPPFSMLRAWARMGFFLQLGVSLLAAHGLTYLLDLMRRWSRARAAIAFAAVTLAALDTMAVPFGMASVAPRLADSWLAEQPGKFAVMEYPIPEHAYSGPAMYSTRFTHHGIIMGYASNPPNLRYFGTLSTFPSPQALDLLQEWGTKFVLVDEKLYRNGSVFWLIWQTWKSLESAIRESGRLKEVATLDGVHIYELQSREIQLVSEELVPNSDFESGTDSDLPGWIRVGRPIIDRSGKEAHGGSSSCSVTGSDYLVSEPIPILPDRCYLLQFFDRRANSGPALIRLQVNWLDALRRPLDPSTAGIRVIDAGERWQAAQEQFRAPAESRYAILYAVAQSGSAWLDDYSLREVLPNCEPSLIAIPNPVVQPSGAEKGRTSISWDSHLGAASYVSVSVNGRPETRFAEGPRGEQIFDLERDSIYEFRLYGDASSVPIKTLVVAPETIAPLVASPVSFPSPSGPGTTTISWNMPGHAEAEVWVSQDGEPEQLFVRGASGAQEAPWIAPGHAYEFRLYATMPERRVIGVLTVRGARN